MAGAQTDEVRAPARRRVAAHRERARLHSPAMSDLPIRPYERLPAAYHPWDPRTVDVARELARLIASARPGTVVEHIGSSAVPGLAGKNVVDLGIEAEPDEIPPPDRGAALARVRPPGRHRAVPADPADAHRRS